METWDALQKDVEMYLAKRPGKTAVSCWLLTEKQGFSIGGKNELPSASLIKLLVLVELCEEVRRGRANLKEAISILGPAITGGDWNHKGIEKLGTLSRWRNWPRS